MGPPLADDFQAGVIRITQATAIGPFPGRAQAAALRARGITHVLNVAASHHDLDGRRDGFRELLARPIGDAAVLRGGWLVQTLDHMHRMLATDDARLFVHCHAGQQRAPTMLWLYLCACGVAPGTAAEWIRDRSPGAEPGHRALVDGDTLDLTIAHGRQHFLPLGRPAIVAPV